MTTSVSKFWRVGLLAIVLGLAASCSKVEQAPAPAVVHPGSDRRTWRNSGDVHRCRGGPLRRDQDGLQARRRRALRRARTPAPSRRAARCRWTRR